MPSATLLGQALISGVLAGGMYGLLALGLSLSWGLLRLVNLSHFALAFLAAYIVYDLGTNYHVAPWWSAMMVVPAMFLIGVGWNFLFTAGTALSLKAYQPEEKDKVQGAINFCVFVVMMITSFSSGALVTTQGWTLLNYISLIPVGLTGIAVLWYVLQGRSRTQAIQP